MSTEACKLCNQESTPWVHINGHICQDCYANTKRLWNKESAWIKCSDRLPDGDQYVLTYSKDHYPPIQIGFYSTFSEQWVKTSTAYPSHWQELPSDPEDE